MKVFKRKLYQKLLDWKNEKPRNSALLIEGARRVGKTTLIEDFAEREYEDYIKIDFMYASSELKNLFNDLSNLDLFFSNLFLLIGKSLKPHGLVIFDEIQFCPLARQGIKKFVADGRYDYIETGSLLSIRDNTSNISIPSEERRFEMYPMDYEEFMWAFGDYSTCELLRRAYNEKIKITNEVHEKMLKTFRLYMALGGMPKVLSLFIETNSYLTSENEKQDIIKLYKDDLIKHDNKYHTITRTLYDAMPSQLNKTNSRYFISNITNKRPRDILTSMFDLEDSKVANVVYNVEDPSYGLELSKNISQFKVYSCDTGLYVSSIYTEKDLNTQELYKKLIFNSINTNYGKIFESLTCQALKANGYIPYYHTYKMNNKKKTKRYEIDFIVNLNYKTTAIEVKSTKRFTTSSLEMLDTKYPQIKFNKIIVSTKPFCILNNITYLPVYMLFCL